MPRLINPAPAVRNDAVRNYSLPPQTPISRSPCLPAEIPPSIHRTSLSRVCPANLRPPSTKPAFPVSARPIFALHPPNRSPSCLPGKSPPSRHQIGLSRVFLAKSPANPSLFLSFRIRKLKKSYFMACFRR